MTRSGTCRVPRRSPAGWPSIWTGACCRRVSGATTMGCACWRTGVGRGGASVAASADRGRRARPVWENELGGLTFEVGRGQQRCYLKWAPTESGIDLAAEAARLRWAATLTPVPPLLARGSGTAGTWILTAKSDPARAVSAIGEGLRAMHDALPVAGCPSWSPIGQRMARWWRSRRLVGAVPRWIRLSWSGDTSSTSGVWRIVRGSRSSPRSTACRRPRGGAGCTGRSPAWLAR